MPATKIIDDFSGRLTRNNIGQMNSGMAKFQTSFGYDPFSNPTNLTWLEQAVQIDSSHSVITDLIVAAKVKFIAGTGVFANQGTYVIALGDSGNLYYIKVNDDTTHNPSYDTPTLLVNIGHTAKYGGSIQFYGATEKIFVGHDLGVSKVTFAGVATDVSNVGSGSVQSNVGRPSVGFIGNLYFGNGSNLIEIDSTENITTAAKLSPAYPSGTYVRDLDVSPDGNYLQAIVTRLAPPNLINPTYTDTTANLLAPITSVDSYKFLWNGTDTGYTSYESYNGYSLTSNTTFGPFNYTLGYDLGGSAVYSNSEKIITLPNVNSPNFGAMFSSGNLLGFAAPEYVMADTHLESSFFFYGQYDNEIPKGLFRFLRQAASSGDIIQMPICLTVSNIYYASQFGGYTGNLAGVAKVYFSVMEVSPSGTVTPKFYKFTTVPTGLGTSIGGVYETQQETSFKLFRSIVSKKFKITNVRFYTEPLVANNSFKIDLIGSDGNPMAGGSCTFTAGTLPVSIGQDFVWYSPQTQPTYSVGVRITNLGSANWTGVKLELDYDEMGT